MEYVRDTCNVSLPGPPLCRMAHTLHKCAAAGATHPALPRWVDLTKAQARGAGAGLPAGDERGGRRRAPTPLAPCLCGSHPGFDTLGNQRGFQRGHGANAREHGVPQGTLGGDLLLEADKADPQMVALRQGVSQMGHTPRQAIEVPDEPTLEGP
jgi:hypothetical protein